MVERSSVQYKTLNPAWFEVFTFRFDHLDDACRERLYLKAYDHDIDSLNDHLGTASVHLGDHKDAFGRGEALYSHLQLDEDPASLRAPSSDAHILRVHLQRARGLRAADKGGARTRTSSSDCQMPLLRVSGLAAVRLCVSRWTPSLTRTLSSASTLAGGS